MQEEDKARKNNEGTAPEQLEQKRRYEELNIKND